MVVRYQSNAKMSNQFLIDVNVRILLFGIFYGTHPSCRIWMAYQFHSYLYYGLLVWLLSIDNESLWPRFIQFMVKWQCDFIFLSSANCYFTKYGWEQCNVWLHVSLMMYLIVLIPPQTWIVLKSKGDLKQQIMIAVTLTITKFINQWATSLYLVANQKRRASVTELVA